MANRRAKIKKRARKRYLPKNRRVKIDDDIYKKIFKAGEHNGWGFEVEFYNRLRGSFEWWEFELKSVQKLHEAAYKRALAIIADAQKVTRQSLRTTLTKYGFTEIIGVERSMWVDPDAHDLT